MDVDWLKKRLSIEEIEAAHMVQNRRLGPVPIPFGFQNAEWNELAVL